ncbi:hypothetical protein [Ensifer sp. SL37]|nr:hypothetical protein [Ensifer sp. SL37]MCY1741003.1 hypothetical protein [Ensifer sp. SL37]
MTRLILLCLLAGVLSGCNSVEPARSKCFRFGSACTFTPLPELWARQ